MQWANLDMENDELTVQSKQRIEAIRKYQMRITSLEIDLARARDQIDSSDSIEREQIVDSGIRQQVKQDQKKPQSKFNQLLQVFKPKVKAASPKAKSGGTNTQGKISTEETME